MITLTNEQALTITTLLREYSSATDNVLWQYMKDPSWIPKEKSTLNTKLEEIDNAIFFIECQPG